MPADMGPGRSFKMAFILREMYCPLFRVTCSSSLVRGFSTASSRLSTVNKNKKSDLEEERVKVQSRYRDEVRQIAKGFRTDRLEYEQQRKAVEGEKQKNIQLERELQERVIEDVKLENERLAVKRARRLSFKYRRQNELNMRREEITEERKNELREKRIAMVQQALEESKDFVTPDNLDEKIAHALEHETNYNFALTADGDKLISNCPPGNLNTELHAPGHAAFMNSPAAQREWSNLISEDSEVPQKEHRNYSQQKMKKGKFA